MPMAARTSPRVTEAIAFARTNRPTAAAAGRIFRMGSHEVRFLNAPQENLPAAQGKRRCAESDPGGIDQRLGG